MNKNVKYFLFFLIICINCFKIQKSYGLKNQSMTNYKVLEIKLTNYKNEQFYGQIKINNFTKNVVFDTGSDFIWVKGKETRTEFFKCHDLKSCLNRKRNWNIKNSVYQIKYGTGMVAIYNKIGNLTMVQSNRIYSNNNSNYLFLDNFLFGESIYEERNFFFNVSKYLY